MDIELAPESSDWTEGLSPEKREAIRDLHRLRPAWNLVALLFAGLWAGAGWAILAFPAWPVRIAGIVLMGAVVHAMAILMHEGVHGNLFRKESFDRWVGFLLGAPALFSCMAYRVNHMLHHAFNRTGRDPDEFTNLSRNPRVLSAAFYAWLLVGMPAYLVHVPLNALRRGSRKQRAGVLLELALLASLYGAVFFAAGRLGFLRELLLCWVYPMTVAAAFGAVRGWAEHMLTRPGHPLTQSRTVTSNAVVSFFMCNLNYHLEHHLFPGVPWYHLPRLHRLLAQDYRAAGAFVGRSYLRFLWEAIRAGVHGETPRGPVPEARVNAGRLKPMSLIVAVLAALSPDRVWAQEGSGRNDTPGRREARIEPRLSAWRPDLRGSTRYDETTTIFLFTTITTQEGTDVSFAGDARLDDGEVLPVFGLTIRIPAKDRLLDLPSVEWMMDLGFWMHRWGGGGTLGETEIYAGTAYPAGSSVDSELKAASFELDGRLMGALDAEASFSLGISLGLRFVRTAFFLNGPAGSESDRIVDIPVGGGVRFEWRPAAPVVVTGDLAGFGGMSFVVLEASVRAGIEWGPVRLELGYKYVEFRDTDHHQPFKLSLGGPSLDVSVRF